MQVFGDMSSSGKVMAVVIIVIVLIAIVALGLLVFRLSGRRLNTAGNPRTRQPRLGVVDAFDLDRQRQLVIVRRDNVEHLLMIGGPNDLLIESAIVRAASATPSVGVTREKEPSAPAIPVSPPPAAGPNVAPSGSPITVPALPAPGPGAPPIAGDDGAPPLAAPLPPRPVADQPGAAAAQRPAGPAVPAPRPSPGFTPRPPLPGAGPNAATPPKPVFASPNRPAPTPRPSLTSPRPGLPSGPNAAPRPMEVKKPEETEKAAVPLPDLATTAPETRSAPEISIETPASKDPAPLPRVRPEPRIETAPAPRIDTAPAPRAALLSAAKPLPPSPLPTSSGKAPSVPSLDALESLEEEMAKLLGRPVPPAEKL